MDFWGSLQVPKILVYTDVHGFLGSAKTPKRRELSPFLPFVVDFLSKTYHILHFDHGAVVKDCFAVEFAEYLMRKHADYADVQGCLSVENRGEIHFKTAVV